MGCRNTLFEPLWGHGMATSQKLTASQGTQVDSVDPTTFQKPSFSKGRKNRNGARPIISRAKFSRFLLIRLPKSSGVIKPGKGREPPGRAVISDSSGIHQLLLLLLIFREIIPSIFLEGPSQNLSNDDIWMQNAGAASQLVEC
ncbi:hypothetical protein CDAR_615191 [Caerostris darwini]|uniref:Uncharacterized protein n=1 Tax=Caerostris darwini TaxID=1538125 RepID=A0AAV4R8T3_9ARAC|nr:hypothetical protein CDAR_615191 [Caerostris darwini]